DSCEDLAEICNDCVDETYRAACQRDVDDNVQSLCDNRVAFYREHCPLPPPTTTTSTTVGSTGGSSAGGANAGGAGSGAMSAGGMGGTGGATASGGTGGA